MADSLEWPAAGLSRFAERILFRARSTAGLAVYEHADGSLGFLVRDGDVAVTRTSRHSVSFKATCRACGVMVATCTTTAGARVSTPCLCASEYVWRDAVERGMLTFRRPATDPEAFAAKVHELLVRDDTFVLFGMVRGFVRRFWPVMGARPDARLWARFYRRAC